MSISTSHSSVSSSFPVHEQLMGDRGRSIFSVDTNHGNRRKGGGVPISGSASNAAIPMALMPPVLLPSRLPASQAPMIGIVVSRLVFPP